MGRFLLSIECLFLTILSFSCTKNDDAICTKNDDAIVTLERLEFTKDTVQIRVGEKLKLKIEASLALDEIGLVYTSSDETIATISEDGVVSGIKEGYANITITSPKFNKSSTCTVIVSNITVIRLNNNEDSFVFTFDCDYGWHIESEGTGFDVSPASGQAGEHDIPVRALQHN